MSWFVSVGTSTILYSHNRNLSPGSFDHAHGLQQANAFRHLLSHKSSFKGMIKDQWAKRSICLHNESKMDVLNQVFQNTAGEPNSVRKAISSGPRRHFANKKE